MARNGYSDGALAGAIGSQVINISLGVGLPALFLALTDMQGALHVSLHEAHRFVLLLFDGHCRLFIKCCSCNFAAWEH